MPKAAILTKSHKIIETLKSAIKKKEHHHDETNYAKYGVKKEASFIGASYIKTDLTAKGKKIELEGLYITADKIEITGAETILVSKGLLKSDKKIILQAKKSIAIRGDKDQIFRTTLKAKESIELKAPTVILNGIVIKDSSSLKIEANKIKIHNCAIDVLTASLKDDGKSSSSLVSIAKNRTGLTSAFSTQTLEIRAVNVCFAETLFTCTEQTLSGGLSIKRAELISISGVDEFPSLKKLADTIDNYVTSTDYEKVIH